MSRLKRFLWITRRMPLGLQRSGWIARYKRPNARRRKARRGPLRSQDYKTWLSETCACIVCALLFEGEGMPGGLRSPVDPAHTSNNGMSSKGPDSACAPLCRMHHDEYDAGRARFERKYAVNMAREAAAHWEAWEGVR